MLSVLVQGIQLNVRAAAVVIDEDHLLVHRARAEEVWSLPGGRVESGESAFDAIIRELREETGETVRCLSMAFVVENFFEWKAQPVHELGFYAYASLEPGSRLLNKTVSHVGSEPEVQLEYRWVSLESRDSMPLYPEFLRTVRLDPIAPLRHIVQGVPRRVPPSEA